MPLTAQLLPVEKGFSPEFPDGENAIPRGHYWIADDSHTDAIKGHVLVHVDDCLNMKDHPDSRRHNGCCGEDGCDGPNRICRCGQEVATLVSDCWTSLYLHFEPEHTYLQECHQSPS